MTVYTYTNSDSDLEWKWWKCKYCKKFIKEKTIGYCPKHGIIRSGLI